MRQKEEKLIEMQDKEINLKSQLAVMKVSQESEKELYELKYGDLESAIQIFGMLMHILGFIQTTFRSLVHFWEMKTYQCNLLKELENDNEIILLDIKSNKRRVKKSIIRWFALFKVNHDGYSAIEKVGNEIDNVMSNLGFLKNNGKVMKVEEKEIFMAKKLQEAEIYLEL